MTENIALYQYLGFNETGRASEKGFDRIYMSKSWIELPSRAKRMILGALFVTIDFMACCGSAIYLPSRSVFVRRTGQLENEYTSQIDEVYVWQ